MGVALHRIQEYVLPHKILLELDKALDKSAGTKDVALREDLLKRSKNGSLARSTEAMYDPILHEYILPSTTMMELKALKDDMIMKRQLFNEMKTRRDHNLENYEIYCDPLVHTYRMRELMFSKKGTSCTTPAKNDAAVSVKAPLSVYRKLNQGDDLFHAFISYDATAE